ncbi:hypothetical protein J6590_003311 [Homalodisca vitripennis]|nr:hypothetical protein J6590_003311 [Homalodisca vitripennis]
MVGQCRPTGQLCLCCVVWASFPVTARRMAGQCRGYGKTPPVLRCVGELRCQGLQKDDRSMPDYGTTPPVLCCVGELRCHGPEKDGRSMPGYGTTPPALCSRIASEPVSDDSAVPECQGETSQSPPLGNFLRGRMHVSKVLQDERWSI